MLSNIKAVADKFGCEFREDAPMSDYTSFKTGGPAELVIMPNSIEALSALISACRESEIKPYIIGNGSNILVSDSGLRGVVLRLAKGLSELKYLGDGVIYADAGVSLSKLCAFALSNNLSGLEFAYGIPGTAGGAAYMNAGAYGGEMKDVLCSVSHINFDGEVGHFEKESLKLGYRCSAYTDSNLIITGLTLKLKNGDYDEIKAAMNLNLNKRKSKQPLEYPSAGSTALRYKELVERFTENPCNVSESASGKIKVSVGNKQDRLAVLNAFGYNGKERTRRLNWANISEDCCIGSFLRGVFLACGTVNSPEKNYHLEFVVPHMYLSRDLQKFLSDNDMAAKEVTRNGAYVLYFKDSGEIEDMLTVMGASNCVLELMGVKMYKDMRNNVNRRLNFESANLDRTVNAALVQIDAINRLKKCGMLNDLPSELREIAELRTENPDFSLKQIGDSMSVPMTRSGVNHRLKKLCALAEKCK